MKVAEAVVDFVGDFASVDAGLGLIPDKAAPIAKKIGQMFTDNLSAGILAGGGALMTVGGFLMAASAPAEKAQGTLKQAVENTGKSWDVYSGKVGDAIKKGEDYGKGAADTQDALTILTVGLQDPAKALADMIIIQDLAIKSGMSQTDVAKQLMAGEEGKGKIFTANGVILAKKVDAAKLAETADKAHAAAVDGLGKAQQKVGDLTAIYASKAKMSASQTIELRNAQEGLTKAQASGDPAKIATAQQHLNDVQAKLTESVKLSLPQQFALRDANAAVVDAQGKVASTSGDITKAQKEQEVQNNRTADGITELGKRNQGIADQFGNSLPGHIAAAQARLKDFAGTVGGVAGPALTGMGTVMTAVGGIMESGLAKLVAQGVAHAAGWVKDTAVEAAELVKRAALGVAHGVASAAQFALESARWLAMTALHGAQAVLRLGIWVGSHALMLATSIATAIGVAAAFLLPLLPFILIGLAVALLVVLIVTHFDQIKAVVTSVIGHIVNFISGAVSNIIGFFGRLPGEIGGFVMGILGAFGGFEVKVLAMFGGIVDKIVGFFTGIPGRLLGVGKDILHNIGQAFAGAAKKLPPPFGAAIASFLESFDQGGIVGGLRGAPRVIVAHGGERVQTEAQQRQAGGGMTNYITVNNPAPEPASTSTSRELRKLAYLGQAS